MTELGAVCTEVIPPANHRHAHKTHPDLNKLPFDDPQAS